MLLFKKKVNNNNINELDDLIIELKQLKMSISVIENQQTTFNDALKLDLTNFKNSLDLKNILNDTTQDVFKELTAIKNELLSVKNELLSVKNELSSVSYTHLSCRRRG